MKQVHKIFFRDYRVIIADNLFYMTNQEKILQLKNDIIFKLKDEIGPKVILLDCPYHGNIGDILIWEGECEFFKIMRIIGRDGKTKLA